MKEVILMIVVIKKMQQLTKKELEEKVQKLRSRYWFMLDNGGFNFLVLIPVLIPIIYLTKYLRIWGLEYIIRNRK